MIKQYRDIKKEHPDKILFYRVGDFYEMFFEDAHTAARELEIVLTSRETGKDNPVPLAGVPYHAAGNYIARLIEKGYKVAVCDQVEDARQAKGLVRREVTRVVTPGTVLEENLLAGTSSNYLFSLYQEGEGLGVAVVEVSTGEFQVFQLQGRDRIEKLRDEFYRFRPAECIYNSRAGKEEPIQKIFSLFPRLVHGPYKDQAFHYERARERLTGHFQIVSLEGFGCAGFPLAVCAGGGALSYVSELYKNSLGHINRMALFNPGDYLLVDGVTRRNLELVETIRAGGKKGSLLGTLDRTLTPMGGRLLKKWLEQPLLDLARIQNRLEGVQELLERIPEREGLAEILKKVFDLERIISRISLGSALARDLVHLKRTLQVFPGLKKILDRLESKSFRLLASNFHTLEDLALFLDKSLVEDPPLALKEGGLIRPGFDGELDQLRDISRRGKDWILDLERQEREMTGIKSLKVNYNRVFGYYIEVTRANLSGVPDHYQRKQTLVNSERFITPELKEYEEKILGAEDKIKDREYELFDGVRKKAGEYTRVIQQDASVLAIMDVLLGFAVLARENNFCQPVFNPEGIIRIKEGRHPVVEKNLDKESFVPNDTYLDREERLMIITGPNMAGKSTYMRQVALICLMAQVGSFVPAREASLFPVDRIFARVGAADDLSGGQSTFMVEMSEAANILNHATSQSLVILDEIGRGTSTFDGMSIARAVIEYLHDPEIIGARVLFATHYHELTSLEETLPGARNYSMAIKEEGEGIIFLRKVIPQKADRSYGIQVARLAGLPAAVVERASRVLQGLEQEKVREATPPETRETGPGRGGEETGYRQEKILEEDPGGKIETTHWEILGEIQEVDPLQLTPLEALNLLDRWHQRIKGD